METGTPLVKTPLTRTWSGADTGKVNPLRPLVLTHAHVVVIVSIAFGVVVAVLTAAVDARSAQLPNRMVTVILATAMLGAAIDRALAGALIGAALYALPFLAIHVARPRRLAFGDVKFAAATGLLVGVMWWPAALLAAAVTCFALATRRALPSGRRRGRLPAGPAFVAGLLVALWVSILIRAGGAI